MAISVRACMPGQRIFTSRLAHNFFDLAGGSQAAIEAGGCQWGHSDKLGSDIMMPTANEAGPNLQRTIPLAR